MPLSFVQMHFMAPMACLRVFTSSFGRIRTKTPMVQSHQTSAWERWYFNCGFLRVFSKRRHSKNLNRPLGISDKFWTIFLPQKPLKILPARIFLYEILLTDLELAWVSFCERDCIIFFLWTLSLSISRTVWKEHASKVFRIPYYENYFDLQWNICTAAICNASVVWNLIRVQTLKHMESICWCHSKYSGVINFSLVAGTSIRQGDYKGKWCS